MRAPRRFSKGLRRVLAAPALLLLVWALNLLVALPGAVVVAHDLEASIGHSEAGERLLTGLDFSWHGETMAEAEGLLATFDPRRLVDGGWLDNLDGWWGGQLFELPAPILAFGAVFALLWILLTGAVLGHLHRPPRRFGLADFLSDGGNYFFRFFRLTLLSAPLYYCVFRLARWIFGRIETATIDLTVERTLLIYYMAAALFIVGLVAAIKTSFDYARIAIVVAERRSAFLAALAGLGFVLRRPVATFGLVALFTLAGLTLVALRHLSAPGVGETSWLGIAWVFALGQVFLLARLTLRLGFLGAELALYEEEKI